MASLAQRRISIDRLRHNTVGVQPPSIFYGMESSLHLLDYELHVASIKKDELSSATHSLLQLALRLFGANPDCRRNHFFSFTETDSDYSIILDNELLKSLSPLDPKIKIDVTDTVWRPLVVEIGAFGSLTGISKIAASVIGPLADRNVSVFCLSTNLDDYVLVKQTDLDKALSCLAKSFRLICDSDKKSDLVLVNSVQRSSGQLDSPVHSTPASPTSSNLQCRPVVHPYMCSSAQYSICGVVPRTLTAIGSLLLEFMFFNPRSSSNEGFFSISVVEEDISVVIDCRDINRFPNDSLYLNEEKWRIIRIGEGPLGFDECGIVAQVSAPLAQAEISTYYICTFYTDHTLVPEESVGKAVQLLNDRYVAKIKNSTCTTGLTNNGRLVTKGALSGLITVNSSNSNSSIHDIVMDSSIESTPSSSALVNGYHS